MAKRSNPLYQEYMRARRNAQSRYYRAKKKGLTFAKNPIPSIPKHITEKSIERLKNLTTSSFKKKATKRKPIEPREIGPVDRTYEVLNRVESEINRWTPMSHWSDWLVNHKRNFVVNPMKIMLQGVIEREGRQAVAMRLNKQARQLNDLVDQLLYGSGGRGHHVEDDDRTNLTAYAVIINGSALSPDEAKETQMFMDNF